MLVHMKNPDSGKMEFALVADSNHQKVLKWFGAKRPNPATVLHNEKRVQFFKNLENSSGGPGSLKAKVHKKSLIKK